MNDDIPLARRATIASRLTQGQAVVAAALAVEFNVSEDAIRRDLRALAAEGICRRVYGGALPIAVGTTPMSSRIDEETARKAALAHAAVALIQPSELIFLDSGSANHAIVQFLPEDYALTVATNSIDIAAAVLLRPEIQLIMIGGIVDPNVGGSVDTTAVHSLSRLNIDRCFIGACAISLQRGIGAYGSADAAFKRAVFEASEHSVLLATNDKFTARSSYRVAAIDEVDDWVVEHDVLAGHHDALSNAGASILKALSTIPENDSH